MRGMRTLSAVCAMIAVTLFLGACTDEERVSLTSASKTEPATAADARDKVQRRYLDELKVGDVAYGESSALWFDRNGHGWLRKGSDFWSRPVSTFRIKIEHRADGYHVWLPSGRQFMKSHSTGGADSNYVAVVLHTENGESDVLPQELVASTIAQLKVGQSAYASSVAMSFDKNRHGWLNASQPIRGKMSDLYPMRIQRRSDGYHVWLVESGTYFADRPARSSGKNRLSVVALHLLDGSTVDRLPTTALTVTIRELKVGQVGYIESWSFGSDKEGVHWLEADYEVRSRPSEKFTVRIEHRSDGYHAWLPAHGSGVKMGRINHDMVRAGTLIRVVKVHATE